MPVPLCFYTSTSVSCDVLSIASAEAFHPVFRFKTDQEARALHQN